MGHTLGEMDPTRMGKPSYWARVRELRDKFGNVPLSALSALTVEEFEAVMRLRRLVRNSQGDTVDPTEEELDMLEAKLVQLELEKKAVQALNEQ